MYNEYFALEENPFNVTSDPDFFYFSSRHSEAFSHLIYGIKQRKGIMVVTGEIGTGKTTLCRTLLSRLEQNIKTALILNPYFSETQLLQLIVKDLGILCKARDKLSLTCALNDFLFAETAAGNNIVVIIDESQNLKIRQLEQIRLLSNLETEKTKLLQIILVGQPELLDKLRLPALRQLYQRVSVRYHLLPLDQSEIPEYVEHRLKCVSNLKNGQLPVHFTPEAYEAIFLHSNGTPRLINILCDRVLLSSFVEEKKTIDKQMVIKSAREVS